VVGGVKSGILIILDPRGSQAAGQAVDNSVGNSLITWLAS